MPRHLVLKMFVAMVVLGFVGAARAEIISVDFELDQPGNSVNRISLEISVLGGLVGDSDTADLSGNVLSNLDIDFDVDDHDAAINTIEFTGGTIFFGDMEFDFGFLVGSARTENVAGTLSTPGLPAPVTGNTFPTESHELTLDQGTATVTGLVDANLSFADQPLTSTTTGEATLIVLPPDINGNVASYRVEMRLPVEFDQEVDANGTPVRVQGSGTVVARTSFTRDLPSLLPSDLTGDGAVDFDDLTILLAAWNTDVSAARGNLIDPENTLIDFQDLTRLLADWTGPADAPTDERAATAAVPEPSSLALLAMAAMSLVGWRRRRKRADRVG